MSDFVVENDNSLKLNVVECIAGGGGGDAIFMMVDIIHLHSLISSSKRCLGINSSWERKI